MATNKPNIEVDDFNPIIYYNEHFINDAISVFSSVKNMKRIGAKAFTYVRNRSDEKLKMFVIRDKMFHVDFNNGLGLEVGDVLSPFEIIRLFKFKGKFFDALNYVVYDIFGKDVSYIRVGTKYYNIIRKRDRYGVVRKEIKNWERQAIIDDFGKDFLRKVKTFNDFTIEPNNKDFKSIVDNNYNLYAPFSYEPIDEKKYSEDKWKWTKILIKHIFGDQYDLGLTYLKTLYDHPKQVLPILVLVSEDRSTGKSTFINWLDILFGENAVIINPQDISSQFNGSYATKNIIMIEESKFDSTQTIEKIKNLGTQKKILVNSKFINPYSIPFYGKLIITSNDEDKFSKIDFKEIRYWVRKVPKLENNTNHNILSDLTKEIPYFLYYLNTLPEIDISKSRMVFSPDEIQTDALITVKKESKPELQKEIELLLDELCMTENTTEVIKFTASDIKSKWFSHNNQISRSYIQKILKSFMKLEKQRKAERYYPLSSDVNMSANKVLGKPYYFKNPYYNKIEDTTLDFTDEPF